MTVEEKTMETVFERIERKNIALMRLLDENLPDDERKAALDEAFPSKEQEQ